MSFRSLAVGLIGAAVLSFSLNSPAAVVKTPHVEAELVAEKTAVTPGQPFTVALRLKAIPHWHTYWKNPGDSGLPTKINWRLPEGYSAGPIQWPYPKRLPVGPLTNFGYEDEVLLLTDITPPASLKAGRSVDLAAQAEWLVCSDICVPEKGDFALSLAVRDGSAAPNSRWQAAFARARAALPHAPGGWQIRVEIRDGTALFDITPPASAAALSEVVFFPDRDNLIENAAPQTLTARDGGYRLAVKLAQPSPTDPSLFSGVLVAEPGFGHGKAIQIGAAPPVVTGAVAATEATGLPAAPRGPTALPAPAIVLGGLGAVGNRAAAR